MTTGDDPPRTAELDARAESLRTDARAESVHDALMTGTAATRTVGQSLSRKAERLDVWRIALVMTAFGVAVSVGIAVPAAQQAARANATAAAAQKTADDNKARAEEAYAAANRANDELKARGQQPVPVPSPREDNAPETLVAAVTARVLASLPSTARYTGEDIAATMRAVWAAYLVANPVQVPPDLVAQSVAAYLAQNPAASGENGQPGTTGEKGDQGQPGQAGQQGAPGPPPTAAQIMDAFNAALVDNPSLLCAGKGTFTLVKGVLTVPDPKNPARQIPRDIWTCEPVAAGPSN